MWNQKWFFNGIALKNILSTFILRVCDTEDWRKGCWKFRSENYYSKFPYNTASKQYKWFVQIQSIHKHKVKRSQMTYCFQWDSEVRIEWTWEKSCEYDASLYFQCYLTTNSYIFYEVANSSKFLRTHSYDLSKPQWQVRLGAGLSVGHSYKFIRIVQLVKYIRFSKNHHLYEWDRTNSYELATS